MELHDLTAAYALDALDPAERREYERHLPSCESCQAELAELQEAAGALALAVDAPPPPPHLRERILERARGERTNVVPLRRRRPFQLVSAAAGIAAAAVVLLALWGVSLQRDLDAERTARAELASIVADGDALHVPVSGASGTLVVARSGEAALVLDAVPQVPAGKVLHAWVIDRGDPVPAGTFQPSGHRAEHVLDEPVPAGATVAVTVEDGPVDAPTSKPLITARAV